MRRALWIAPLYPLGYWLLMAVVTVRSTLPALLTRQPDVARWASTREPAHLSGSGVPEPAVVPSQRTPVEGDQRVGVRRRRP